MKALSTSRPSFLKILHIYCVILVPGVLLGEHYRRFLVHFVVWVFIKVERSRLIFLASKPRKQMKNLLYLYFGHQTVRQTTYSASNDSFRLEDNDPKCENCKQKQTFRDSLRRFSKKQHISLNESFSAEWKTSQFKMWMSFSNRHFHLKSWKLF